ncbi:hypothetical protein [Massilia timonae]|uniref:hypothetical protein n=1 Tax=Massilia timonae TaxID=47229 RepID=UPI0028D26ECD|nr:hypothetical protein [Massilia timonae]
MIKHLAPALLVALMAVQHATASSCAALDYQEMKDMPTVELLSESCEIGSAIAKNLDEGMAAIGRSSQPSSRAIRQTNFDNCIAQARRVDRILETKGITKDTARALCRLPPGERQDALSRTESPTS